LTRVNKRNAARAFVVRALLLETRKATLASAPCVRITGVDGRATKFRMVLLDTCQNQSGDIYLSFSLSGVSVAAAEAEAAVSHNNVLQRAEGSRRAGTLRFRL